MPAGSKDAAMPIAKYDSTYDLYRNCVLNELYYGRRLSLFSRAGFWLEIIIVIGSGASGVSGWVIWTRYPNLAVVWGVIAAAATLLAALRPVLQTDAKIKRYSKLFSGYRQLALSMKMVVEAIAEDGGLGKDLGKEVDRIAARYRNLALDDDPSPSRTTIVRIQNEINARIPPTSLFFPAKDASPPRTNALAGMDQPEGELETKVDPVQPWPKKGGTR